MPRKKGSKNKPKAEPKITAIEIDISTDLETGYYDKKGRWHKREVINE